jgi:LysM repeat protein
MQGCRREPIAQNEATNAVTQTLEATNVVADTNPPVVQTNLPPVVEIPPASGGAATDYAIAKGDNFSTLAKNFHVTVKAIADANPGVDSTKLQIGQKIHIPAPTAIPAAGAGTPVVTANGEQLYTVKSGDTLIKIAQDHGTSVKALRSLNNLKTDNIKVGQKLKIPAKGSTPAAGSTTPSESAPGSPSAAPATPR